MSAPAEDRNIGSSVLSLGKTISDGARIRVLAEIAHAKTPGDALAAVLALGYASVDLLSVSRGLLHDLAAGCPGDAEKTFLPNMMGILKSHLREEGIEAEIMIIEKEKP